MKRKFFAIMLAFVMCFAVAGLCIGCASKTNDKTAYELWLEQGHSGTMDDFYEWLGVKDGPVGEAGVGIASVALVDGKLVITYTNGSKSEGIEVPTVPGNPGEPGAAGVGVANIALEDGKLVVTYTDGSKSDPIEVPTVPGNPGADGVGIKDITISEEGVLTITYTDDRDPLSFNVKGEQGDAGDNGLGFDNIAVDNGDVVITIGETVVRIPANIPNFCAEHDYDEVEFAPHTCDENNVVTNGVYMQVCRKCGLSKIVREARHNYEDDVIEATCTTPELTAKVCTECGHYIDEVETAPALGHAWTVGYTVAEEGKTICEDGGMIVKVCTRCDLVSEPELTDAIGHNVATWSLSVPATKDAAGEIRGACSQCPNVVVVALPKLSAEHYAVSEEILEADCTKREVAERYTVWVNAKGELSNVEAEGTTEFYFDITTKTTKHNLNGTYLDSKVDAAVLVELGGQEFPLEKATCTSEGRGFYTCSTCNQAIYVTTNKLPHVWNEEEAVAYEGQEPTCTETGLGTAKCYTCDETVEVVIPATGHPAESLTYAVVMIGGEAHINTKCSTCGMDENRKLEGEPVIVEATCESEGSITYSYKAADGETYTHVEPIGKLNHLCGEVRIGATCLAEDLIANGGQEFPLEQSTCTKDGRGFFVCSYCEQAIYVTTLAHGKHSFDEETYVAPTCTTAGKGTCTSCGLSDESIVPALGHAYELKVEKLPTATETGLAKVVCAREENGCGHTVVHAEVVLPVLGDSVYEVEHEVLPTCNAYGNDIYTIHVLAWDFANGLAPTTVAYSFDVQVATIGHTLNKQTMGTKAPWDTTGITEFPLEKANCENEGRGYYTCEVCNTLVYITTTGEGRHDYTGSTPVVVAPTCTEVGTTTGYCTICGEDVVEYAPALDHVYEFVLDKAPSADEEGSAKVVCTREENGCGHSVINTYVLPVIAEGAYELEVITAPTCSTAGVYKYTGHALVWDFANGLEPTTVDYNFSVNVPALGHDSTGKKIYEWSVVKTEKLPVLDGEGNEILDEDGLAITKDVEVTYDYEGFLCEDCHKMIVTSSIAHINGYTVTMDEEGNPVFADEATSHVVPELVILRGEVEEPVLDEAGEPTLDAEGEVVTKTVVYELTICVDADCELVDGLGFGLVLVATYEVEVEAPEVIA